MSYNRIIIICKGPTEQEFCKDILVPYFSKRKLYIHTPLIKPSGGGIVPWAVLKRQIETHLKQDKSALVTLFIDYYGIPERYNYPRWKEKNDIRDLDQKVTMLEKAMLEEIPDSFQDRFIPYIQVHEFEALLFSDLKAYKQVFDEEDFNDLIAFSEIFRIYKNPEEINDRKEFCPSARLEYHIKGFNKVIHGSLIAQEIGLEQIRKKCLRFSSWIDKLENTKKGTFD
ncbi:MAG: DUF4276 family protein [Bacteroidales bacterium]|nr:DUF4276 family protein [Bacteroidales bacterium]MCF8337184.1 DUF4276 family protein [Bacteroidales bacterium]